MSSREGAHILRAKIDMNSGNINLRDPAIFRIKHATHYRTGTKWCIYPMYDFAHSLSDAIEGITHSLCTLEFEDHRPLYDWFLDQLPVTCHPQQIEFARGNLSYTVTSKRKLLTPLVTDKLRSTAGTIRACRRWPACGVADIRRKPFGRSGNQPASRNATTLEIDFVQLESAIREDLNKRVRSQAMAVLRPLRVVIENYPEGEAEELEAVNNPEDARSMGTRKVPFARVIYIEQDDFRENPPKQFFRLSPGREVRLRYAYFITCTSVVKNDSGEVVELRCSYDPATRGGDSPDGRSPKATMHWVSASHAIPAEVRLYDRLFTEEKPSDGEESGDFASSINPNSARGPAVRSESNPLSKT